MKTFASYRAYKAALNDYQRWLNMAPNSPITHHLRLIVSDAIRDVKQDIGLQPQAEQKIDAIVSQQQIGTWPWRV